MDLPDPFIYEILGYLNARELLKVQGVPGLGDKFIIKGKEDAWKLEFQFGNLHFTRIKETPLPFPAAPFYVWSCQDLRTGITVEERGWTGGYLIQNKKIFTWSGSKAHPSFVYFPEDGKKIKEIENLINYIRKPENRRSRARDIVLTPPFNIHTDW